MRSVLMVIVDVFVHKAFQMLGIENNYMVEQIAATVPDPSLRDTILPRTPVAGLLWLNAEVPHRFDNVAIEL